MITQQRLQEVLDYDPNTGIFTWKEKISSKVVVGRKAGSLSGTGYHMISLFKKKYRAHHLVWLFVYGIWPKEQIDHKNGIRTDNRLCNLREATNQENCQNTQKRANNTSGCRGVCWNKAAKKWQAYIRHNYQFIYLGIFKYKWQAIRARKRAEQKYQPFRVVSSS